MFANRNELHLRLDLLAEGLELIHITSCGWPLDAKALGLIGLRNLAAC